MFSKVLEEKNTYKNSEGVLLKDLTESIFINVNSIGDELCSYYRVSKDMEMRPDKISTSLYGENKYTEIILKYSNIDNPFSLEEGDFIIAPSFSNVYYNVKDLNDHEKDDTLTDGILYSLNYNEFTALNTAMIQDLQKENEELKSRIAKLEELVGSLINQ